MIATTESTAVKAVSAPAPCAAEYIRAGGKKDFLAACKAAGLSRSQAEREFYNAVKAASAKTAALGSAELTAAAARGHKVSRRVTKTGGITLSISAKSLKAPASGAKDAEIAALKAEIARLKGA